MLGQGVKEIIIEETLEFTDKLKKVNSSDKIAKLLRGYQKSCNLFGLNALSESAQKSIEIASEGGPISPQLVNSVNSYLSLIWQAVLELDQESAKILGSNVPKISITQNNIKDKAWWHFW